MDHNQQTVGTRNATSKRDVGQLGFGTGESSSRWLRQLACVPLRVVNLTEYDKWARETSPSTRGKCSLLRRTTTSRELTRSCGSRTPREGLIVQTRPRHVPVVTAGGRQTDRCLDMRPAVVRFKHITTAGKPETCHLSCSKTLP